MSGVGPRGGRDNKAPQQIWMYNIYTGEGSQVETLAVIQSMDIINDVWLSASAHAHPCGKMISKRRARMRRGVVIKGEEGLRNTSAGADGRLRAPRCFISHLYDIRALFGKKHLRGKPF